MAISIDGAVVPTELAVVSVMDRGLLYGDGCFEVLRTWDGRAVDLDAHVARLAETATWLRMPAIDRARVAAWVTATIRAAPPGAEHRVRIVVTRGAGGLHVPLAELPAGRTIIIVEPLLPQPVGVTLATVAWEVPSRGIRGHKTLAYLDHLIARELARDAGADEAVRLDHAGCVVEGATSNVFAVVRGTVVTTPVERGALPGIVRGHVLELCAREKIATAVRPLTLDELRGAEEAFVTSSLRGVVPVTALDGVAARATPPRITMQLARAYHDEMHARASRLA